MNLRPRLESQSRPELFWLRKMVLETNGLILHFNALCNRSADVWINVPAGRGGDRIATIEEELGSKLGHQRPEQRTHTWSIVVDNEHECSACCGARVALASAKDEYENCTNQSRYGQQY